MSVKQPLQLQCETAFTVTHGIVHAHCSLFVPLKQFCTVICVPVWI